MMTLHMAKGLEFPLVFLVGWEEGLFPHGRSSTEERQLEEERRLAYVGMTRAQTRLYLSYAESRRLYGQEKRADPSRFVGEIPKDDLHDVRARAKPRTPVATAPMSAPTPKPISGTAPARLRPRQRVRHAKFGEGVVLQVEGEGYHTRARIDFPKAGGPKWLIPAATQLEIV